MTAATLRRTRWFFAALLIPFLVQACGGGDGPSDPPTPVATSASAVSGGGQTGIVGQLLGESLVIRVLDQNGDPIAGVTVNWSVASGGGSVSPTQSSTGADGQASTDWTLGGTAGAQSVSATPGSLAAVSFSATGDPAEPSQVVFSGGAISLDALGATAQASASVADEFGNAIAGAELDYSSSDEAVATVSDVGLVTAVANGTATITASSGELEGTTEVTVAQVVTLLEVAEEAVEVPIGTTYQIEGNAEDANGNEVIDPDLTFTSSDEAVATVDDEGLITGVAEGTATVTVASGSVEATIAVTVVDPPDPFEPAGDETLDGDATFASVTIPAGVTITVSADANIQTTGDFQVDGTLAADCSALNITAGGDLTINGTVENQCDVPTDPESAADLNITAEGAIDAANGTLMSTGDILVNNTGEEIDIEAELDPSGPSAASGRFGAMPGRDCNISGLQVAAGGNGSTTAFDRTLGQTGATLLVVCGGNATFTNATFVAGDGQRGGDDLVTGMPGDGGPGGVILVIVRGDLFADDLEVNPGEGGDGGDGRHEPSDPGADASAFGGDAGDGGLSLIRVGGEITVSSGGMTLNFPGGGDGGDATAIGADGGPNQDGGSATAIAGDGGSQMGRMTQRGIFSHIEDATIGPVVFGTFANESMKDLVDVVGTPLGSGGSAVAQPGNGGPGTRDLPDGANAGEAFLDPGDGGDSVLFDDFVMDFINTPGSGGSGTFRGGMGGAGFRGCFLPGGLAAGSGGAGATASPLGEGTDIIPSGGLGGAFGNDFPTPAGPPGVIIFDNFGNGGPGGSIGDPIGVGGPGGLDDELIIPGERSDTGTNMAPGASGGPCLFVFDVTVSLLSDPNNHDCCTGATSVTQLETTIFADGFESGDTSAWSSSSGTYSGPVPAGSSGQMAEFTFETTGVGTVAGFSDVTHTITGTITLDDDGSPASIEATIILDSNNNRLPANGGGVRNPVSYTITGTVSGS